MRRAPRSTSRDRRPSRLHIAEVFLATPEPVLFDAFAVLNGFQSKWTRVSGRIACVVLMLALWLAAVAFSSSTRLHSLVCADSQQANHDCLLTSFAKGHFLPLADVASIPITAVFSPGSFGPALQEPLSIVDMRLAPSRAPPSFLVSR